GSSTCSRRSLTGPTSPSAATARTNRAATARSSASCSPNGTRSWNDAREGRRAPALERDRLSLKRDDDSLERVSDSLQRASDSLARDCVSRRRDGASFQRIAILSCRIAFPAGRIAFPSGGIAIPSTPPVRARRESARPRWKLPGVMWTPRPPWIFSATLLESSTARARQLFQPALRDGGLGGEHRVVSPGTVTPALRRTKSSLGTISEIPGTTIQIGRCAGDSLDKGPWRLKTLTSP